MGRLRFILLLCLSGKLQQVYGVWPLPQSITQSNERYVLNPHLLTYEHANDSAARGGCSVLDAAFKRYFRIIFPDFAYGTGFTNTWSEPKPFTVSVSVRSGGCDEYPDEDSDESYNLSVSAGQAVLRAESVWGALRGLESFSQLVYQDDHNSYFVNKTEIVDFPRFPFRGLLLDTSRHYLPVHAILKTLDAMAYNKFNVFHWHIVDDPSFPYQSHTFPDLSNKGAFHPVTHVYTQSDVRRVIAHARFRGIRVVPEFDSPGHTQSWGKGQPDLLTPCYKRTVPSGTFGPINPTLSSSYQFMNSLFKEVTSVFPDSFVHLGGDEVDFTCWKSNPNVQAFMAKMGFGHDYFKLESFYMESIMNITAAFNKTSIVWQDVFDYHKRSKAQYVVEVWKRGCYLCKVRQVAKAGLKVILAAPFYLDLPGPTHNWARYYTVRPLSFKGTEQQKKLVIGGEVCMWGEYVDATNLSPRLWPRASAAAERLWSNEEQTSSVDEAFPRLEDFRCKMIRRGIQAEPLFIGHCKHEYIGL
ncbi:beta-hexosaminidase subunit alpha [Pangasianodon hypophthalmus]|uniref:beta-hexosaminidase subunit alpha n=1 Tax=Pangasianodon hypophthalmus TaxID=310915 RepID=UPI000EFFFDA6|nr:beta-hexosaminidase subunit alpha [Pangasianodon hypophthalmus]